MENWCHILDTVEVVCRFSKNGMVGMYRIYKDGTEALVEDPLTLNELSYELCTGIKYGRKFDENYHGKLMEYTLGIHRDTLEYEDGYKEYVVRENK